MNEILRLWLRMTVVGHAERSEASRANVAISEPQPSSEKINSVQYDFDFRCL